MGGFTLSSTFRFLTEVLLPVVKTEFQLLYVYHLVGPFLQRFQQERTRCMIEVRLKGLFPDKCFHRGGQPEAVTCVVGSGIHLRGSEYLQEA